MDYGNYKSHPNILLDKHVDGLIRYYRNFKSSGEGSGIIMDSIIFHDWGKQNKYFQDRMEKLEKGMFSKRDVRHDKHAVLSAMKYFIEKGNSDDFSMDDLKVLNIILGHHGYLNNYSELIDRMYNYIEDEDIVESYKSIEDIDSGKYRGTILTAEDLWYENKKKLDIVDGIDVRLYYSQLVDADRLAAMRESNFNIDDLREERFNGEASLYLKALGFNSDNRLDKVRKQVRLNTSELLSRKKGIFTYTLPTGLGKTVGAARLAEKINGQVIYVVPYLSISDQTYDVFHDIYKYRNRMGSWDFLVKHDSRLNYQDYDKDDFDKQLRVKDMIVNWHSKVIITTTVQFFESLIGVESGKLRKIHNTYGATILIDEPQAIPYEKWEFLKGIIKGYADKLNWKVIYLSATPPNMGSNVKRIVRNEDHIFKMLGRTELQYVGRRDGFQGVKDWSTEAWYLTKNKNQILWLVNIEKLARKLYLYAHGMVRDRDIIFISGKLPPIVRSFKIKKLREKMARGEKVLVISTQVLEAGVDLDFDGIVRDLAPLPTLIQVAGRLNRKWERERERLYVMQLLDDTVYSDFEFRHTGEVLAQRGNLIREEDYYEACQQYYELCEEMPPSETPREWMEQFIQLKKSSMEMIDSLDYQGSALCMNVDDWLQRCSNEEKEDFYETVREVTGYEYRGLETVLREIEEFNSYVDDLTSVEDKNESLELLKGLQRYVSWFQTSCSRNEIKKIVVGDSEYNTMTMPYLLLKFSRDLSEINDEITKEDLGLAKSKEEEKE